jgi:hypothetical protein
LVQGYRREEKWLKTVMLEIVKTGLGYRRVEAGSEKEALRRRD